MVGAVISSLGVPVMVTLVPLTATFIQLTSAPEVLEIATLVAPPASVRLIGSIASPSQSSWSVFPEVLVSSCRALTDIVPLTGTPTQFVILLTGSMV